MGKDTTILWWRGIIEGDPVDFLLLIDPETY